MRKLKQQAATKILTKKEKFSISRGRYKGMRLFLESNSTTRPTKALVKKSFFDTMQDELFGKTFIECFAGSGQIGFEALSLGANHAIFFENNIDAFKNLCDNIKLFWEKHKNYSNHTLEDSMQYIESIQDFTTLFGIQAYFRDCLQSKDLFINFAKSSDFQVKNDIIPNFHAISDMNNIVLYMDPPFSCRMGFENIYVKICRFVESFNEKLIQKVDIIAIESMSDADISEQLGAFHLAKKSKFGQTTLMYFIKK